MLTGKADIDLLATRAPRIARFGAEAIELDGVTCFQMTLEMHKAAGEAVLPSGLHPTLPPALSLQAWDVEQSPWGPFSLAMARVSCRSGVRARGFTTACYVTTEKARDALAGTFGFPASMGRVDLNRYYDRVDVEVIGPDDRVLASIRALDPDPMSLSDVQYTSTMNLAHTPNGLRLVQVEADHVATRVERLRSELLAFDAPGWGNAALDPYYVVAASVALERITLPAVRFVCKPDELAFTGTEPAAVE